MTVPLFFFPEFFLHLLGWVQIDAALARLVAAALFLVGMALVFWFQRVGESVARLAAG